MDRLENLTVLILDCQTTGAGPARGSLLEVGWLKTSAAAGAANLSSGITTWLVNLPDGTHIPKRVQQVTGISEKDMLTAIPPESVWKKLAAAACQTAGVQGLDLCPAIVHYARFETPFLVNLHGSVDPGTTYPLQTICTHQIAGRLIPELPRLGLRAVAGYLGHSVPENRRCGDHIAATAVIWKAMVDLLKPAGIHTLVDLVHWLAATESSGRRGRAYPMDADARRNLPDRPGIYRMLRSNGDALYVGKATSLKKRVNSYFHKGRRHAEHILEMLTQAVDIDVTRTGSALEAATLESDEIKRLSSPYNVALRDKGRMPGFCSSDFRHQGAVAGGIYRTGPLPSVGALQPLTVLMDMLDKRATAPPNALEDLCDGLLPEIRKSDRPDRLCLARGLDIFCQRHNDLLNSEDLPAAVRRLGVRLWRIRREEKAAAAQVGDDTGEPGDGDNSDEIPEAWTWTPETVALAMESIVRRGTHWIRRGRWFCLLSESALLWASRDPACKKQHLAEINRGHVRYAALVEGQRAKPHSNGWETPLEKRLHCFDLAVYDRMRIVTTEIRRLVADQREIALFLSPTTRLGREKLSKLLAWL